MNDSFISKSRRHTNIRKRLYLYICKQILLQHITFDYFLLDRRKSCLLSLIFFVTTERINNAAETKRMCNFILNLIIKFSINFDKP